MALYFMVGIYWGLGVIYGALYGAYAVGVNNAPHVKITSAANQSILVEISRLTGCICRHSFPGIALSDMHTGTRSRYATLHAPKEE